MEKELLLVASRVRPFPPDETEVKNPPADHCHFRSESFPAKLLVAVLSQNDKFSKPCPERFLEKAFSVILYLHLKVLPALLYRELTDLMLLSFPYLLLLVVHGAHFEH